MAKGNKLPKVLVIHGPNLNMLGGREPKLYGKLTLNQIDSALKKQGKICRLLVETFQSNHEGEIVEQIQKAMGTYRGLIINPAAYTHTSIAIRDALLQLEIPIIEVHLSNIHKRETFRHISMIADIVTGRISGLGAAGYRLALDAMAELVRC